MSLLNRSVGTSLDLLLAPSAQERLGQFILRRVRGEDNDDVETNGEYALLRRLASSPQSPTMIFDVGANKGDWTKQACASFGNNAEFFAFEPVNHTYAYLAEQMTDLGKEYKVTAMHLALGDSDGVAEIQISGKLAGSNSFYKRQGTNIKGERSESVRVIRGDSFCRQHNIRRIGFLKIDTEGHEMAVLRGFDEMLSQRTVDLIQFEYGGCWIDARTYLKDAFALLSGCGYRLGRLMPDRVEWFSIYRQDIKTFRYSNWVAALPGVRC
jgi:FkbM family methyltransferase